MRITACRLCPRRCGADRTRERGFCGGGPAPRVARAALHFWEEPCLSGERGSGAVFFSGCPLRCCYCQNHAVSAGNFGQDITPERLSEIFLALEAQGAHNVNLVSPTPHVPWIIEALGMTAGALTIPVVYNTGGYESVETLRALAGMVGVYLPDIKYQSGELSGRYSSAPDYFTHTARAVEEMVRQTGPAVFDEQGIMTRGVLIRHLAIPGCWRDSVAILRWIAENLPRDGIRVSLMRQFTPMHESARFPEINRRLTTYEYEKITDTAAELGLLGYVQLPGAAGAQYVPTFDLTGV
ncbi:MAG: radical SAM protein [Clostridiales bacterium]|nr:radical SAM protein [Clostridiales bacterium]